MQDTSLSNDTLPNEEDLFSPLEESLNEDSNSSKIQEATKEIAQLQNINSAENDKTSVNLEGLSSQLDEFLMYQPPEIQRRVRKTVEIWDIDKDDPYFLILLQCRITQILIELAPNAIRRESDEFIKVLEHYKNELSKIRDSHLLSHAKAQQEVDSAIKQLQDLGKSISTILQQNQQIFEDYNIKPSKSWLSPKVIVSIVTASTSLVCLASGFLLGSRSAFANNWQQKLEAEDRSLLHWAKSSEGQFSKNLLTWNPELSSKNCQQYVQNLGITFQIGSKKATSGFCFVFIDSPAKREFQ